MMGWHSGQHQQLTDMNVQARGALEGQRQRRRDRGLDPDVEHRAAWERLRGRSWRYTAVLAVMGVGGVAWLLNVVFRFWE